MLKTGFNIAFFSSCPLRIKALILLWLFLSPLFALLSSAATIYVPSQYSTIQAAINAATDGDEIIVSPDTYVENINFGGKNIILRSTDPTNPSVVASTIIDGNNAEPVVTFSGTELTTCVLSGFTITNGNWGIYGDGTLTTIQNNIISDNSAGAGGGVWICNGTIENNTISSNLSSGDGGGLYRCDGTIRNNNIYNNSASDYGGGLYLCNGTIQNNTIYGNSAQYGGGLYACRGPIINCIIWENTATTPDYSQLCVSSNPFYSCVQNWAGGGRGNISAEPKFVDPANRDFHLQSDSPCIDVGNTFYLFGEYLADIDGECRLAGSSVDMGSDEYGSSVDRDGDLLADSNETMQGSDPNNPDTDGDGLKDGVEVLRGTNPTIYNTPSGISIPAQYSSIQQGIFLAFPSEVITVSPGTYHENLHFLGKNVILKSVNPYDEDTVNNTIINGDDFFSVVYFNGSENETCAVKGFTIRDGRAYFGGGINGNNNLAKIDHNKILSNQAIHPNYYGGGGLFRCNGTIRNNVISGNLAMYAGGGLSWCSGTIQNNIISDNAAIRGGALWMCNGTIQNNTIYNNAASSGGAFCGCYGFIINCIIWENYLPGGSQFYESSAPFFSCVQDWTGGGRGNISADPKFVDPANGNYHLQADSPCIDAGNKHYLSGEYLVDMDGECRLVNSSVDMGCDEYGSTGDSDGDLLADSDEAAHGSDPNNPDTDGDGLKDGVEVLRGTNPIVANSPLGISIPTDYASIQQGLFMAFPLEAVTLTTVTYHENLHFLGKNVILQSVNPLDDDIISSTTIDGDELFSVIFFEGTEKETCVVKGLTIRNGLAYSGGGICGNYTQATIDGNKVVNNSAHIWGGGVYECDGTIQNNTIYGNSTWFCGAGIAYCEGTIQNNTITSNSASSGGGGLLQCHGIIQNNTIHGNTAQYDGGGLYACDAIIQNNTISANSANQSGGGLRNCDGPILNNTIYGNSTPQFGGGLSFCHGLIQNNTIYGNSAIGGAGLVACNGIIQNNTIYENFASIFSGGLEDCDGIIQNNTIYGNSTLNYGGGLNFCDGTIQNNTIYGNSALVDGGGVRCCEGIIRNCIIWGNSAPGGAQYSGGSLPSYCCIQDWGWDTNIDDDPLFVDPDNADFHLQPISPCIDAGCYVDGLTQDFEGEPRPWDAVTWESRGDGSDFDIGADEYVFIRTAVRPQIWSLYK